MENTKFIEHIKNKYNNKCVICGESHTYIHSIIASNLFTDSEQYNENNFVLLCSTHAEAATKTLLSTSDLRLAGNIKTKVYPLFLYDYTQAKFSIVDYDRYGNPITKVNKRLKGFYFDKYNNLIDKQILLNDFIDENEINRLVDKYPSTPHLYFSPGTQNDDKKADVNGLLYRYKVIISEKCDGQNSSLSEVGVFARSRANFDMYPWSSHLRQKHRLIKNDLKHFNIEICGENMAAEHSIIYSGLDDHFYVFGVKNSITNKWLSWDETEYYAELFDFKTVPVLNKNLLITDESHLKELIDYYMSKPSILSNSDVWITPKEGVVVRIMNEFYDDIFYQCVFKYVRANHVQTDQFWINNIKRGLLHQRSYLGSELSNFDKQTIQKLYEYHIKNNLIKLT